VKGIGGADVLVELREGAFVGEQGDVLPAVHAEVEGAAGADHAVALQLLLVKNLAAAVALDPETVGQLFLGLGLQTGGDAFEPLHTGSLTGPAAAPLLGGE